MDSVVVINRFCRTLAKLDLVLDDQMWLAYELYQYWGKNV
jgi:hypothetical protein